MRKRILFLVISLLLGLQSCDDGDLTIDSVTFSGTQLYSCVADVTTDFLYKTEGKQALILTFSSGTLKNQEGTITGTIPTDIKLLYRSFSETPSSANFCSIPPPISPTITSQIEAKGGTVQIVTQAVTDPQTQKIKYNHLITIKDLVILNDSGEKLIQANTNFGVFQTSE